MIDAHPLVRRAFEHHLGVAGRRRAAQARAGFLHGRPDRRRPATLEEAREEVELFHAYCDGGLWPEADAAYAALARPRYRFLAAALEHDLLLRFFPEGDWHRPSLWSGFHRSRDLAICLELLGLFEEALLVYRETDAALRGDALLALGRLGPLLDQPQAPPPWQMLWGAYRAHALCLAGLTDEAVALARSLVPMDIYEWTHVFECLLRAGRLDALDLRSFLYRPPHADGHRWADLARERMRADYLRVTGPSDGLGATYETLIEDYDRGGLPYERTLTRLGYARLAAGGRPDRGGPGRECDRPGAGSASQHGHRGGRRLDRGGGAGPEERRRRIRRNRIGCAIATSDRLPRTGSAMRSNVHSRAMSTPLSGAGSR